MTRELIDRDEALKAVQEWTYCCDAEDAIAALPAVTVGVRPLVWRSNGKGRICADTPFGAYEVEHGRYGMRLLHSGSFMQDDLQGIEAAKAAAQADFDARILAALDLTPAPDAAALSATEIDDSKTLDPVGYAAGYAAALREAAAAVRRGAPGCMLAGDVDELEAYVLALLPKGGA